MKKHPHQYHLLLLGLIFSATPVQAEIYTWTDASGNTVFSDQAREGASQIKLPPAQTYTPSEIRPSAPTGDRPEKNEPAASYRMLSITQPIDDQALWANNGQIDIVVAIDPALIVDQGHHITITLDGQVAISNAKQTHLNLLAVDRGSHTLQAIIQNQDDKTLIQSKPVTFHVHRQSVLHKK